MVLCTNAFSAEALFLNGMQASPDFGLWAAHKGQIEQFKNQADKKRGLCAGVLIKHFFDVADTDYVSLKKSSFGNLYANRSAQAFSMSHSGRYAVFNFGNGNNGVDIEKITDGQSIARSFFDG